MKPWEKYQTQTKQIAPWEKYQAQPDRQAQFREDPSSLIPEPAQVQAPPVQQGVDFSASEMVGNIPGSAGQLALDLTYPIRSWDNLKNTNTAIGGLIMGTVEKLIPGRQEQEKYADAVVDHMKNRYGSLDKFKATLQADPVGVLSDAAAVATGGGTLAAKIPGKAGQIARATRTAGLAIDPINLAVNAPKAAIAAAIPKGMPAKMYESAAKFPPGQVDRATREKIIKAALENQIMPTGKGLEKATAILSTLDDKIDTLIKTADKTGKTISRKAIYSDLKTLRKELSAGADAPANLRKSQKIIQNLDELLKGGPDRLTPSRMQKFKVTTYRDINWKGKPTAKTETMKALAKGARKSIEDITPEIRAVNQQYGPLAELRNRLPQVANRIDNRNPLSLSTLFSAGVGGGLGDVPGAILGSTVGMANNPKILASAALKAHQLQQGGLLGNMTNNRMLPYLMRQGLIQSGRGNQ